MAARVADVPEAPKRWDPLPGIVQLLYQVTRAQIEIFHLGRACPFQGDEGRAHLHANVELGGEVSSLRGSAFTFSSAAAKNSTASRLAERAAALAAASRR